MAEVVDIAVVPRPGAVIGGPANGVAGLVAPVVVLPNPENSDGGAAPSFFSAVGAVEAAVVLAGCPPRENAGKVGAGAPSFFSSGFPFLFAVAPKPAKSPPPAAGAAAGAVLSPVKVVPPKLKAGWG
jgi:hypothetical protein